MFADSETRAGSFEGGGRRLRVAGLALAVAAGLMAAGLAGASEASADVTIEHSAKGGELDGGRLTLRGVSGRAAYATSGGSSGKLSVRRLHRRMFLARKPATGTLQVAGQRGDDRKFRLSKPRYNAARHTVSYRAKPLTNKRSSGAAARAAGVPVGRFGAASLSIVPHPTVATGDNGGNDCIALIQNSGASNSADLNLVSSSKWDTDTWTSAPQSIKRFDYATVESDGGAARGCHWEAVWTMGGDSPAATISMEVTWPWGQGPSTSCSSTNPGVHPCTRNDQHGQIGWNIGQLSGSARTE
jgi:hypothetical protein